MTIYRRFTSEEIKTLADELKLQLSEGILPEESRKLFKFRGQGGKTWTVIPETGEWYIFTTGWWQPAAQPDQPLDGSVEILDLAALSLSPREKGVPAESQPVQGEANIREMIEQATRRVWDSYRSGKINSAEAENLLMNLYLLDPAGLIWSYGIHSGVWYFFRGHGWESAGSGEPNPQDFAIKPADKPSVCRSCGTSLSGGKFCSECGDPVPLPEAAYSQAALEVVERFTEADADPLPEPVVPEWKPAAGLPEVEDVDDPPPAEPVQSSSRVEWQLRISEGGGAGESFRLDEHTRLGRRKTNQIVLTDEQCSLSHAEILQQDEGYVITDQDSTNGTMVNGVRIESPATLHLGDIISIGNTKLVVEEGDEYPETVIIKGPRGAESNSGTDQPEPSDSPPKKRRNIVLVFVLVFVVTLLSCLSVGLGGYYLIDHQGLLGVFDRRAVSEETFTNSSDDEAIAIASPTASPAPTELPSEITDAYGHVMVLVPAGEFEMGADAEVVLGEFQKLVDPEYWEFDLLLPMEPVHTVNLDDYYIDKFEVTNAQYAEFLNEQGNQQESGASWLNDPFDEPLIAYSGSSWQVQEEYDDHPVIGVTWYGARAYCRWRGARLPSEAEWEKAARGTDGRLYPWGNTYDGGRLNVCDSNCPLPFALSEDDDGYSRTAPVDTNPDGVSPYGVFNMTGNASEWVEDWWEVYPGGDPDSSDTFGRVERAKRGGSWGTTGAVGTTFRSGAEPDESWITLGFRCSRAP